MLFVPLFLLLLYLHRDEAAQDPAPQIFTALVFSLVIALLEARRIKGEAVSKKFAGRKKGRESFSDSAEKPSYAFFLFGLGRWRMSQSL